MMLEIRDVKKKFEDQPVLEGISLEGEDILVSGGEEGILAYADPSYGAAPMLRTSFTASSKAS